MTNDIDLATGLPKLPDGLRWKVAEESASYWGMSKAGVRVSIVEDYEERGEIDLWLFSIPSTRMVKRTRFLHSDLVQKHVVEKAIFRDENDPSDNIVYVEKTFDGYKQVTKDELTAELILETAKSVLEEYNQRLAGEKLLGDYPPKKLPVDA